MKKRIGSVILTLAMMLTLFPAAAVPARAEEAEPHAHSHSIKTVNTETDEITETAITGDWTALDMSNVASHYTLTSGNYYLTENLELGTSTLKVSSGVVNLCLNGHDITSTHSGTDSYGAIYLTGGTLNIFDDSETAGVIQNTSEEQFGGWGIYVSGNSTTLKLHGGTIKGGIRHGVQLNSGSFYMFGGTITDSESGVYVGDSANLYMAGGSITGNSSDNGGGVYNNGSFTMTGGTISDNTTTDSGGGVYTSGTFTMKGGKIGGNKALSSYGTNIDGGGVYVSGGTFDMSGTSEVSGNMVSATRASVLGGGIYVNANGTVTIKDNASVKDNTAQSGINGKYAEGGGIYIDKGKVTIQGSASITGNQAINSEASDKTHGGGVCVAGAVSGKGLYISGSTKITGNKSESSAGTTNDNVYLYSSALINVAGALSSGASIGVKMAGGNGTFTGGYSTHNSGTEPDTYFFSDAGNEITLQSNEAYLTANPAHVHDGITFKAWTATDALPTTAGNYYLTDSVTLAETWSVPDGTTNLCLNGKSVTLTADTGSVIYVGNGKTLNLYDESGNAGKITGGKGKVLDIGIAKYAYGGGVYNIGTFTMSGGAISGNSADYGGGVYSAGSATFAMSGGAISNNTSARDGGGVYNYGSGTFNMSGGEISNNTSQSYTGGGVRFFSGTMTVSGTARITDNKSLDSNRSNVYLSIGTTLNVGTLEDGASIGVSLVVIPGSNNVANPYPITGATDGSAYKDYFFSDIDSPLYKIEATDDGKVAVAYYCTVTFNMNGHGNAIDNQSVYNGGKFTKPDAPTEDGYTFGGWYTSDTYQTAWDFDSTVSEPSVKFAAKTLYAKWTETPAVAPTVTAANVTMTYGDSGKSVSVTATPAEGHTITGYQWYSNKTATNEGGKPISGATERAYALTGMDAGTYYYYCVVTTKRTDNNQTATATSNAATVTVNPKNINNGNFIYRKPDLRYDGTEQTFHFTSLEFGNDNVTEGTDYTLSNNTGTNADTYTLTITGIGNYTGTKTHSWTIYKREATLTWSNTTFTYDGTEKCPTATVSNLVNSDTCAVTVTGAQTDAGTYTATATELGNSNYRLPSTTYNPNANSKSFTIDKAAVTAPSNPASKTYTGETLKADISSDEQQLYIVKSNAGGVNAGNYDVVLELVDKDNYKWSDSDSPTKTLKFAITQAANEWTTAPSISGWTYNGTASETAGATKFGDVVVKYKGRGDTQYDESEIKPENAGDYTATFTVAETGNYTGLTETKDFTVTKAIPSYMEPSNLTAAYGQTLADVELTNGWSWDAPSTSVGNLGTHSFPATFTPSDTNNYNTASASLSVTVGKATPTVEAPAASNTLTYGQKLSAAGLTSGWNWVDGDTIPTVTNSGYEAVKSVTDYDNYDYSNLSGYTYNETAHMLTRTVAVTVNRASMPDFAVNISGWTYGSTASSPSVENNSGGGAVTYEYKAQAAEDTAYSTDVPESAGDYTVRATVPQTDNYNSASATKDFTISKASQSVSAPTLGSATINSITLSAQSGEGATEYAKNTENAAPSDGWQTSPTFTELTQNTEYYFFTRFNGNGNYEAATSAGAKFSTSSHAHNWTFSVEGGVITATCISDGDCDLHNDGGSVTLTAPTENLVYNTESHNAAVNDTLSAKTGDTVTVKYEYKAAADGSYAETSNTVNAGYYKASVTLDTNKTISVEYQIAKATPEYTEPTTPQSATYGDTLGGLTLPAGFTWDKGNNESVGNVGNNSFNATFTPDDTANYNTVQKTITVNVSALPEAIITAGDVTTDYINETIGGFANGTYIITADGDSAEIEVTDRTIPIDNNYFGKDITIVKKAEDANHTNSSSLSISIPARPSKPSGVEVTKATDDNAANGKITGVDDTMEYKVADDEAWTQIDGNEVTELLPGTYYVRIAPTDGTFASEAVTAVIGVMDKVTVVFIDGDGNTLDTQIVAPYTTVTYDGDTPTKTATAQFTYEFTDWDKAVGLVTEDTTFTAQFGEHLRSYKIKWIVDAVETETDADYGTMPSYGESNPTKAADEYYTYVFDKWTPDIVSVAGAASYTALFNNIPQSYTVTLNTNGGAVIGEFASYSYGTALTLPTAEQITKDGSTFIGWYDNAEFEGEAVTEIAADATGNKEYFAKWKLNGTTTSEVVDNSGSSVKVEVENLERIAEGLSESIEGDVEVVLEITKENADSESAEQAAIEAIKTTNTVEYYDIALLVNTEKQATAPENISIKIPYDTTRVNITVYRYDAAATAKAITLSAEDTDSEYYEIADGYITIHTSSFATYAIGYDAPAATTTPRHSSGGGSSKSKATPTPSPSATPEPTETAVPESTATPVPTEEPSDWWYTDVPETEWYYTPIKSVTDKELMTGVWDGENADEFRPDFEISRAMFVTVLYRIDGEPETKLDYTFEDILKDWYYEKAVAWGSVNGIIAGYDEKTFAPDDKITREQMAAMLWRYAKYSGVDISAGEDTNILSFSDAENITEYAIPAIQWVCGAGIINGYTDSTLRPQANTTRAQAAVVFGKIDNIINQ